MCENQFYGWFDDPDQAPDKPSYEPPRDGPCLYCGKQIQPDDVRTYSLMLVGKSYAKRSYFYRTHRTCADEDHLHKGFDDLIFEMIDRNGD